MGKTREKQRRKFFFFFFMVMEGKASSLKKVLTTRTSSRTLSDLQPAQCLAHFYLIGL